MHSKMIKPIAAAIIIVAALLSLTVFNKTIPQAYAIEQTVKALRGVHNLRMSMSMGSQSIELLMLINQQTGYADHIRMNEPASGNVTITIPGQTYLYKKDKNEVTFLPQELLTNDLNFKDVINSVIEQTNATDGRIEIMNQFSDLAGKEVISVTIIRKDESTAGEFLIDPDTNLPIYLGIDSGGRINYMGPIEYDVEIPDNAFEFVIPKDAKVIDNRPEELKTQKSEPAEAVDFNILETAMALQSAYNGHGILIDRQGRRVEVWAEINPKTGMIGKGRLEYEDGGLYIMADGKTYFEDDGMVGIKDGYFFYSDIMYNNFIAAVAQLIGNQDLMTIEKTFSDEFGREVISVSVERPWVHLDALIDPDTKRPIKLSVPFTTNQAEVLDHTELIEYNVDLPPGCFDFETGPEVMVLGNHLDKKFANDPNYGMPYDDTEDIQDVCRKIAARYLQAKIDLDIDTIKQLHSIYTSRVGSNKMIEKSLFDEISWNGRIIELLEFKPAYEYRPRQMMVPCKVVKEYNDQRQETFSGVIVYLREQDGQKSAVITGFFPRLIATPTLSEESADLSSATYAGLVTGEFMQKWLVMGPFPVDDNQETQQNAFDTEFINPAVFEQISTINGTEYQWHRLENNFGYINLTDPFKDTRQIIYARAQIEMPEEMQAVLGIGSDDAVKIWLNGELVHENWVSRGVEFDNDRVPVTFKQGMNNLVLKIQNQGGPWGFCCRRLEE